MDARWASSVHASRPPPLRPRLQDCQKQGLDLDEIVNAQTADGATPMFYAAKGGNLDAAQALLKTGRCVVNKGTRAGFTPLWIAALRGRPKLVALLLQEYGIQVSSHGLVGYDRVALEPVGWYGRSVHRPLARLI